MSEVLMKVPVVLRGKMATSLLKAAEELGMEPSVIRSQSDGFKVPQEVHEYLYPSQYEDPDETPVITSVNSIEDIPGAGDDDKPSTPAEDFGDGKDEDNDL